MGEVEETIKHDNYEGTYRVHSYIAEDRVNLVIELSLDWNRRRVGRVTVNLFITTPTLLTLVFYAETGIE